MIGDFIAPRVAADLVFQPSTLSFLDAQVPREGSQGFQSLQRRKAETA
jgi:hypothetical protein